MSTLKDALQDLDDALVTLGEALIETLPFVFIFWCTEKLTKLLNRKKD